MKFTQADDKGKVHRTNLRQEFDDWMNAWSQYEGEKHVFDISRDLASRRSNRLDDSDAR